MTKHYRNHNIRFNMTDEGGVQAWERLHSAEVEQDFKSQNAFVMAAINDYYERHLAKKNDPYLESREKEDAFADRLVQTVEQKLLSNLPALAAMYQMQQQAFFQAGLQAGGIMSYPYQQGNPGAEASVGVKLVTEPIQGSEQPIEVVKQELSEPEENEFLDCSFGVSSVWACFLFGYSYIMYCIEYYPCGSSPHWNWKHPQKGSERYDLRRGFIPPISERRRRRTQCPDEKIRRPPDPVYRRLSARRSRVRRADAGRFRLSVHEKAPHPGRRPQGVSL